MQPQTAAQATFCSKAILTDNPQAFRSHSHRRVAIRQTRCASFFRQSISISHAHHAPIHAIVHQVRLAAHLIGSR